MFTTMKGSHMELDKHAGFTGASPVSALEGVIRRVVKTAKKSDMDGEQLTDVLTQAINNSFVYAHLSPERLWKYACTAKRVSDDHYEIHWPASGERMIVSKQDLTIQFRESDWQSLIESVAEEASETLLMLQAMANADLEHKG